MNYEYVISILVNERKVLTQDSDFLSNEVKTCINTISTAESKSVNDLSDSAMVVAMNLKEYRDRLDYLQEKLDLIVDRIKEIDSAILKLNLGDSDV